MRRLLDTSPPATRGAAASLVRYGVMGVAINLGGYLVYLLLTAMGLEPKLAMSLVFFSGTVIGYFGHRQYSFRYSGGVFGSVARYALAHSIGYATNYALLAVFSDHYNYPHELVQAAAIVIVAAELFLLFRFVVFRSASSPNPEQVA